MLLQLWRVWIIGSISMHQRGTGAAYSQQHGNTESFCSRFQVQPLYPLSEEVLCCYVAFLAGEGLKHRTIKAYLSAIRFKQITQSLGNPFTSGAMSHLECVLGGIKRVEAHAGSAPKSRLPITIDVLCQLQMAWLPPNPHPDSIMLWAAVCVGFFGFLHAGEFTLPMLHNYDPETHFSVADITFDSHISPS